MPIEDDTPVMSDVTGDFNEGLPKCCERHRREALDRETKRHKIKMEHHVITYYANKLDMSREQIAAEMGLHISHVDRVLSETKN